MADRDLTLPVGGGKLNIRVGAIILRDGQLLMVDPGGLNYLFTVGGRVQFGESTEEAVVREVFEETGVRMEIDRLGFVHEAFFPGASPEKRGFQIQEFCFFYYMKVPQGFSPRSERFADSGPEMRLRWIPVDSEARYYPEFFRTELAHPSPEIRHIVTRE